jgi:uncharacterized membrane protein
MTGGPLSETSSVIAPAEAPDERPPTIELGLVVTPVLGAETVQDLGQRVALELRRRFPDVNWKVSAVQEALVTPPASLSEVVDAARSRLLAEQWDLVVYVTELPMRISRRPVVTHSSRTHGAAVVSLPALGLNQSSRRLVQHVADAVSAFAGDTSERREDTRHRRRVRQRLLQLATDVEGSGELDSVALLHRVATGNLRLLLGMVRANHPWQLAVRLTRALIGALGVALVAVGTSDVWRIAATLPPARLGLLCAVAVVGAVASLIVLHGLWERVGDRRLREQAMLFNLVTAITIAFGILALFAAVTVVSLAAAMLTIEPAVLSRQIGRSSGLRDYVRLAVLASALATVGAAFGGALESDAAVRDAAYAYRPGSGRSAPWRSP